MSNEGEIYFCEICEATIKVMKGGTGELVCCGKPMILEEKTYTKTA